MGNYSVNHRTHTPNAENAHFPPPDHRSTCSSTNLIQLLHPHCRPYTALLPPSAITTPSPVHPRDLQHITPNQHHLLLSSDHRAPTELLPHRPRPTCRYRPLSVGRDPYKTANRFSSHPSSYSAYINRFLNDSRPIKINLRPSHSASSRNATDPRACNATRQGP